MKVWLTPGKLFDKGSRRIAIIPIGSLERHGDFLPLGTDTLAAIKIAEDVGDRLSCDVYPPIWYGVSPYFKFAGGTVSIEHDVFKIYVTNILKEIARNGYDLIVIINGHGGNTDILTYICRKLMLSSKQKFNFMLVDWWRDLAQDVRMRLFNYPGHAGEDETSIMLYLYHEYVDEGYKSKRYIEADKRVYSKFYSKSLYKNLYPEAYLGDPSKASIEKGKEWYDAIIEDLIKKINDVLSRI